MRRLGAAASVAVLVLVAGLAAASVSRARAPEGFFGVVPQAPLESRDLGRIDRAELSLRIVVPWSQVEPQDGAFDFAETDRVIGGAVRRGIRVLVQVGGVPSWVSRDPAAAPVDASARNEWKEFLRRLVGRYGPRGELWGDEVGIRPVRRWQIWNEPNFPLYWRHPSPAAYAKLLHASAQAIKTVDPGAVIVAAAVAPIEHTMRPWEYLRRLYRVPGVKRDFDLAALHPYAASWRGIVLLVRRTRRVMAEAGDGRTRLLLTELGVASDATEPTAANLGPIGQARFLESSFGGLYSHRRAWRVGGVYWYSWKDGTYADDHCSFCQYSGLLDGAGDPKPAWTAMKRVLARFGVSRVR